MQLKPDMMSDAFAMSTTSTFALTRLIRPRKCTRCTPGTSWRRSAGRRTRTWGQARDRVLLHGGFLEPGVHSPPRSPRRPHLGDAPRWVAGGGAWTPPTPDSIVYLTNHLPPATNWNLSVMDPPTQWGLLAMAISMGGHARVGWEDNPYLPDGTPAKTNAELVDVVVRLAESMGRSVR